MANKQSVVGTEKLEVLQVGRGSGGGNEKRHEMTGVGVHDLASANRPVNPLGLITSRMLNHHRRCLRSLTIPHLKLLSPLLWFGLAYGSNSSLCDVTFPLGQGRKRSQSN